MQIYLFFKIHFSYFVKIDVKIPIGRNLKFCWKMWFFLSFYQCFRTWNFEEKKTQKNNNKKIEKDSVFTIDNVILKISPQKKMILSKKSIFRLIMTSNIFHLKIIFYIEKMISKKIWSSKKSFPSNVEPWLTLPPP